MTEYKYRKYVADVDRKLFVEFSEPHAKHELTFSAQHETSVVEGSIRFSNQVELSHI